MPVSPTIRLLATPAELTLAVDFLTELNPPHGVLPLPMLTGLASNGNLILGAFFAEQLIGLSIAFLALDHGPTDRIAASRLKLASHLLLAHPNYRQQGLGHALKLAQLTHAEQLGLRLITWGFDPLDLISAHLSIRSLGGIARDYDHTPSDHFPPSLTHRLLVEWWPNRPRVQQRLTAARKPLTMQQYLAGGLTIANPPRRQPDGSLYPADYIEVATRPLVILQVPTDSATLQTQHPELAAHWRTHLQRAFQQLFAVGFIVTDFVQDNTAQPEPTAFYVLSQGQASL